MGIIWNKIAMAVFIVIVLSYLSLLKRHILKLGIKLYYCMCGGCLHTIYICRWNFVGFIFYGLIRMKVSTLIFLICVYFFTNCKIHKI